MEEKTWSSSPAPFPNNKAGCMLLQKRIKVEKSQHSLQEAIMKSCGL